jgi:hypothetical protein
MKNTYDVKLWKLVNEIFKIDKKHLFVDIVNKKSFFTVL